jgi:hypothetical protein
LVWKQRLHHRRAPNGSGLIKQKRTTLYSVINCLLPRRTCTH